MYESANLRKTHSGLIESSKLTLAVCGNAVAQREDGWYIHHSFGRILDHMAPHFRELHYHGPRSLNLSAHACDYRLRAPNIHVHPWAARRNSLVAMKRPHRVIHDYWCAARTCDALFLRGSSPLFWTAHWMARVRGIPVVHWMIANLLEALRAEDRGYGPFWKSLGVLFTRWERLMLQLSFRACRAHVLANGAELARIYSSPRTTALVSTTITEQDFLVRSDTCQGSDIRLLFVGFVRPEKGLAFLIEALPLVQSNRPVRLAIVGSWDQFPAEHKRLTELIEKLGLQDRVCWEGYAPFGRALFDQMDRSDILVLPSLSEGTPRVLVEARARSLPIVSTNVGGIPSSVEHGQDGLLVPPRDPAALAQALSRIIQDGELRRRLTVAGRESVKSLTVERFAQLVVERLTVDLHRHRAQLRSST